MYRTKEDITAALRRIVHASAKDTLQNWKAPFVHVGGSGTHYPLAENDPNWDLIPKFHTGYSVGPFRPAITEAQEFLDDNRNAAFLDLKATCLTQTTLKDISGNVVLKLTLLLTSLRLS